MTRTHTSAAGRCSFLRGILGTFALFWLVAAPLTTAQTNPPPTKRGITPANRFGNLRLTPSERSDHWPHVGEEGESDLSPNFTATIKLDVAKSGRDKNGRNYVLGPSGDGTWQVETNCSDPRCIWTGQGKDPAEGGSTSFRITNTARDNASAALTVNCIWVPVPSGGGGGGGRGQPPPNLEGFGDATLRLLDSVAVWNFSRRLQTAEAEKLIGWTVDFYDENGWPLNVAVGGVKPAELTPESAAWTITSNESFDAPRSSISGTVSSAAGSRGKMEVAFSDGSDESSRSSNRLTFFSLEVRKVEFTSDHAVLKDYDADFAGEGGSVFSPRGWQKEPAKSNPVTHSQGKAVEINVTCRGIPADVEFDLDGECDNPALEFNKKKLTSTGQNQLIKLTAGEKLPAVIDHFEEDVRWTATAKSGQDTAECKGGESSLEMFVTWDKPIGTPTIKRMRKVESWADGGINPLAIADLIGPLGTLGSGYGGGSIFPGPNGTSSLSSAWQALDGNLADCGSLSTLMKYSMELLGVSGSEVRYVFARHQSWNGLWAYGNGTGNMEHRVNGNDDSVLGFLDSKLNGNNYEGCCFFGGKWWMGGTGEFKSTPVEVLIRFAGPSPDERQEYFDQPNVYVSYPAGSPP